MTLSFRSFVLVLAVVTFVSPPPISQSFVMINKSKRLTTGVISPTASSSKRDTALKLYTEDNFAGLMPQGVLHWHEKGHFADISENIRAWMKAAVLTTQSRKDDDKLAAEKPKVTKDNKQEKKPFPDLVYESDWAAQVAAKASAKARPATSVRKTASPTASSGGGSRAADAKAATPAATSSWKTVEWKSTPVNSEHRNPRRNGPTPPRQATQQARVPRSPRASPASANARTQLVPPRSRTHSVNGPATNPRATQRAPPPQGPRSSIGNRQGSQTRGPPRSRAASQPHQERRRPQQPRPHPQSQYFSRSPHDYQPSSDFSADINRPPPPPPGRPSPWRRMEPPMESTRAYTENHARWEPVGPQSTWTPRHTEHINIHQVNREEDDRRQQYYQYQQQKQQQQRQHDFGHYQPHQQQFRQQPSRQPNPQHHRRPPNTWNGSRPRSPTLRTPWPGSDHNRAQRPRTSSNQNRQSTWPSSGGTESKSTWPSNNGDKSSWTRKDINNAKSNWNSGAPKTSWTGSDNKEVKSHRSDRRAKPSWAADKDKPKKANWTGSDKSHAASAWTGSDSKERVKPAPAPKDDGRSAWTGSDSKEGTAGWIGNGNSGNQKTSWSGSDSSRTSSSWTGSDSKSSTKSTWTGSDSQDSKSAWTSSRGAPSIRTSWPRSRGAPASGPSWSGSRDDGNFKSSWTGSDSKSNPKTTWVNNGNDMPHSSWTGSDNSPDTEPASNWAPNSSFEPQDSRWSTVGPHVMPPHAVHPTSDQSSRWKQVMYNRPATATSEGTFDIGKNHDQTQDVMITDGYNDYSSSHGGDEIANGATGPSAWWDDANTSGPRAHHSMQDIQDATIVNDEDKEWSSSDEPLEMAVPRRYKQTIQDATIVEDDEEEEDTSFDATEGRYEDTNRGLQDATAYEDEHHFAGKHVPDLDEKIETRPEDIQAASRDDIPTPQDEAGIDFDIEDEILSSLEKEVEAVLHKVHLDEANQARDGAHANQESRPKKDLWQAASKIQEAYVSHKKQPKGKTHDGEAATKEAFGRNSDVTQHVAEHFQVEEIDACRSAVSEEGRLDAAEWVAVSAEAENQVEDFVAEQADEFAPSVIERDETFNVGEESAEARVVEPEFVSGIPDSKSDTINDIWTVETISVEYIDDEEGAFEPETAKAVADSYFGSETSSPTMSNDILDETATKELADEIMNEIRGGPNVPDAFMDRQKVGHAGSNGHRQNNHGDRSSWKETRHDEGTKSNSYFSNESGSSQSRWDRIFY